MEETAYTRMLDRQYETAEGASKANADAKTNAPFTKTVIGFTPAGWITDLYDLGSDVFSGNWSSVPLDLVAFAPGGDLVKLGKLNNAIDGAVDLSKTADRLNDTKKLTNTVDAAKVEQKAVSKADQLAKNKAAGKQKEGIVKSQLEKELKPNEELLEQATFKMDNRKTSRPDFTIVNKENKSVVKIIDSKAGGGKLTKNQKQLEKSGGTLTGKKAGEYKGSSTGSTKIETR